MPELERRQLADCEISLFEHLSEEMRGNIITIRDRCFRIHVFSEGRQGFGFCDLNVEEEVRAVFNSFNEETTYAELCRIANENDR